MLLSRLLCEAVQLAASDHLLILNSAADPFVPFAIQHLHDGSVTLAEDNVAALGTLLDSSFVPVRHVAFHDYILQQPVATMDVAVLNLLYQPSNAWMLYALQVAFHALRTGGCLYMLGAKDRGVLSQARHMQELFGNCETLTISKGQRVLRAYQRSETAPVSLPATVPGVFAASKLDEGTRLLLDALIVHTTDSALDLGCGAGFIGLHIARLANKGSVTMVDASLAAITAAQQAINESGLTNIRVLSSDGAQAVLQQQFNIVATNPPFHQGGIQTTEIAERFIREAAQVLHPHGRFYLVANRFLKYEPMLLADFKKIEEIGGNTRYKVLQASEVLNKKPFR